MIDPTVKAKLVLETEGIGNIPALSLGAVANSEGIGYRCKTYPDEWDGMLVFKGDKRAILVNTRIDSNGRHNFTFAHELGHYFLNHQPNYLQNGQRSIRCSVSEMNTMQKGREAEANRFAVEFLMPEERFRFDMLGAEIDFGLITSLSNLYMVSKHACSTRLLALTSSSCIIVRTRGNNIVGFCESRAARGFLKKLRTLPEETAAYLATAKKWGHDDFVKCEADKWFARSVPGSKIYECTHVHAESGAAMTILKW